MERAFARALPGLVLVAVALFAALGPSRLPVAFFGAVVLAHGALALAGLRSAVGCWRGLAGALRASKTDWDAAYEEAVAAATHDSALDLTPDEVDVAVLVPNFREPEEVLRETLEELASHERARRRYTVVLAMEGREERAAAKGRALADVFRARFREVRVTLHPPGIAGEAGGKGANLAWAAKEGLADLADGTLVAVLDADALVPETLFRALASEYARLPPASRPRSFFPFANVFDRNAARVPALVRQADVLWGWLAFANLGLETPCRFPMSNYALPLGLVRRVGGWDAGPEGVGEDLHTFLKCEFTLGGRLAAVPILVPASCRNVQGGSYVGSLAERLAQALRHMDGASDLGYALARGLVRGETPRLRALGIAWRVYEAHMLVLHATVLSAGLAAAGWRGAAGDVHPLVPCAARAALALGAAGLAPTLAAAAAYEAYHAAVARPGGKRGRARWLDWLLVPAVGLAYVALPQACAHLRGIARDAEVRGASQKGGGAPRGPGTGCYS